MDFGEVISSMNFLAVLVATLSAFVLGALWYGPLFGKLWMKLNGFTPESVKVGGMSMPVIMITNFAATLISALALAMFLGKESDWIFGLTAGIMVALFWIATNRLNDVLYEKKPLGLWILNVGYALVSYAIMGAILGAWH